MATLAVDIAQPRIRHPPDRDTRHATAKLGTSVLPYRLADSRACPTGFYLNDFLWCARTCV